MPLAVFTNALGTIGKDSVFFADFVAAGGEDAALEIARTTELFTLAESLGAVESLIEHPGRMTHAAAAGSPLEVDPALIRLSVGLDAASSIPLLEP